jgi:isoamylase
MALLVDRETLGAGPEAFMCFCVPLSGLIKFRRQHPLLGRPDFLRPEDVTWYEDNWDNPDSKFLAFSLHDRSAGTASHPPGAQ